MAETASVYTAAVVGGGMGGRLSLRALSNSGRFRLVAACDLRPEICRDLERDFPGIRTFGDHRTMLRECPVDVVCVATFPASHREVVMDALERPLKGILVEKPLGHDSEAGREILAAIKARDLPIAVPHGLLVKRVPLEIIERVRKGDIGELKLIEIQCRGWDIINAGIHWLNFCVTLNGRDDPPVEVLAGLDAGTRTYRDGMQVETIAVTSVRTRSGVRIIMHTGDTIDVNSPPHGTVFRLVGTLGQIEFWGWEDGYRIVNPEHPRGALVEPEDIGPTRHQRHLDRLAEMIDKGMRDYSVANSSQTALELCEAAYRSARQGRLITLPLATAATPAPHDWSPGLPYSGEGGGRDGRKL